MVGRVTRKGCGGHCHGVKNIVCSEIAHTWVRMAPLTSDALLSAGEFTKEVSGWDKDFTG